MNDAKWFAEIWRDPETGEKLEWRGNSLLRPDGKTYPVHDGIVSIVHPAELGGEDAKMNRFYNLMTPLYDFLERSGGSLLAGMDMVKGRAEIVERLNLQPGMKLLEVSPGPGVFQRMLRERVGPDGVIISLDLSLAMLRQCRTKNSDLNIHLVHGNGQALPFAAGTFDAVFHFGGVNLFNDPAEAIREFCRVTGPGGIVAWGDEGFSSHYAHHFRRKLLTKINPGFQKPRPLVPPELNRVSEYEVYDGLAYLAVGEKS